MSAQSLFSKKNIKAQQPDTHRGIMEELNFPPQLISFVRENARNLQIGLVCVVILVLGWLSYDYYTKAQEKKGASQLASAMQLEETDEMARMLENVINDYSRTDAARWARIELAHLDYREGRLDAAVAKFEEVIDELSKDNPVLPLVRTDLAQSYEKADKYDQAIVQYGILKDSPGFKEEAHLALARIYRAKDEPAKARQEYEELMDTMKEGADPQLKSRVQEMLLALGGTPVEAAGQPEDNK
jgi:predicted negative regulator of RcsB-dependent stress response